MAVKDHSLDEKIIKAALTEFMEKGFQNASLHKIAANAGITTGALYTRYTNKDALFCSLVEELSEVIREKSETLKEMYYSAEASANIDDLFHVIDHEKKVYLDILFEYYDECKLFFCRSAGSSAENAIRKMVEMKVRETVEYIRRTAKQPIDLNGIEMIITGQFSFYKMILEKGYNKEQAFSCMNTVNAFFEAGWRALFKMNSAREQI